MTEIARAADLLTGEHVADFSVVAERYDRIADQYDALYSRQYFFREDRIVANTLARIVQPGDRVLDLGCGTGKALELLPPHSWYLGIDPSAAMLARAQAKFPRNDFMVGDARDLRVPDSSVEFVVSTFGSMSHVRDLDQVVEEIARVLVPGGRFYVMLYGLEGEPSLGRARSRVVDFVLRGLPVGSDYSIPAWLYSQKDASEIFGRMFDSVRVQGLTLAARETRPEPAWRLLDFADRMLSRALPDRAHSLIVTGSWKDSR